MEQFKHLNTSIFKRIVNKKFHIGWVFLTLAIALIVCINILITLI
jgi:hypothetical protein